MKNTIRLKSLLCLLLTIGTLLLALSSTQATNAQCTKSADGKTYLKFSNESSYELTFFVDDDEKATVASRAVSAKVPVSAGEHILRARVVIDGVSFWVYTGNEVPQGHVCIWTIEDPAKAG